MSLTLYRRSVLGETLIETLRELKLRNKISEQLELKTLEVFDKLMCDEISSKFKNKTSIKGKVTSFKNCDDIWIFYSKEVLLKSDNTTYTSQSLKIVACDEKMKQQYVDKKQDEIYNNGEDNN